MKKILIIIFAILANVVFSQEKNTIYPKAADTVKPESSILYESVDRSAEFPDGLSAFRNKVMSSMDTSEIDGSGKISTEVTFVVERDGTMTNIEAKGSNRSFNTEAENTLKRIKEKWNPAYKNNKPVRYRLRLPLTMQFE